MLSFIQAARLSFQNFESLEMLSPRLVEEDVELPKSAAAIQKALAEDVGGSTKNASAAAEAMLLALLADKPPTVCSLVSASPLLNILLTPAIVSGYLQGDRHGSGSECEFGC